MPKVAFAIAPNGSDLLRRQLIASPNNYMPASNHTSISNIFNFAAERVMAIPREHINP
jgi:hypothetical protein